MLNCKRLLEAAAEGNPKKIKECLKNIATIHQIDFKNEHGETPLFLAVRSKSLDAIQILLEAGANVNAQNLQGDTPLHTNIFVGMTKTQPYLTDRSRDKNEKLTNSIIKLLLKYKANVDIQNKSGETPLFLAIRSRIFADVEILVNSSANVNVQNTDGDTPLHINISNYKIQTHGITQLLVKANANANIQNKLGQTPLHCLAIVPDTGTFAVLNAYYLLDVAKAAIDLKDKKGMSPLNWAATTKNNYMVSTLLEHGANPNDLVKANIPHTSTAHLPTFFSKSSSAKQALSQTVTSENTAKLGMGIDSRGRGKCHH